MIQCSLDEYVHNGWNMDYQALPPADLAILASPDATGRRAARARSGPRDAPRRRGSSRPPRRSRGAGVRTTAATRSHAARRAGAGDDASRSRRIVLRTSACRSAGRASTADFAHPLDYIGFDGGGGIGSGPGMAVGAALALRGGDRLPVAVLGDGDYLMGLTALWTGVHYRVPVLIVVANNESFFNDELHQERMARMRGRPVENRWIGMRMSDPDIDLAGLARDQGAQGLSVPCARVDALAAALREGVADVQAGAVAVIDVRVAPEYSRAVSASLMRHIPAQADAASMLETAARARPRLPQQRALYYGGAWHESAGGREIAVIAPGDAASRSASTVDAHRGRRRPRASRRRATRFYAWRDMPAQERAKAIRARPPRSCSPTPTSSRGSKRSTPAIRSRRCASTSRSAPRYMEYFAGLVTEIKGDTIPIGAGTLNYTLREPLGVVGRIGAFNHPLLFTAGKCGAPLVTGNTLVVKPADQTPLSSLRIAELWHDVFPPGVFNVVTGGRDAGVALVAHPKVAKIGFIGSVPAGRAVMSGAERDAQGADARARRQERAHRVRGRDAGRRSPKAWCAG